MTIRTVGQFRGQQVLESTLEAGAQRVYILNYGCVVRRWVRRIDQVDRDLVLGFDTFEPYPTHSRSFGIVAGRVANRTAHGRFTLDGVDYQLTLNNGLHHLHGGRQGLGSRVWDMEQDTAGHSVRLGYHSPAGEEGYPGAVAFEVVYRLDEHGLHCSMQGVPDRPTPVNLAQHNYYNLDGEGDVLRHRLWIDAEEYLPVSDELIPTGERRRVDGTMFDFRQPRTLADADPDRRGHDHNLILRPTRDVAVPAARLVSSDGSLQLELVTAEPGLQLYTAAAMQVTVAGLNGRSLGPYAGLCLEAQHFPDALNQPGFASIICTPERPYHQSLSLLIREN